MPLITGVPLLELSTLAKVIDTEIFSDKTWPIKRPRPLVPLILELLVKIIDPENIFQQKPAGGKRARPLVPPRLALLAIRRKLISGGSHNWGGRGSK